MYVIKEAGRIIHREESASKAHGWAKDLRSNQGRMVTVEYVLVPPTPKDSPEVIVNEWRTLGGYTLSSHLKARITRDTRSDTAYLTIVSTIHEEKEHTATFTWSSSSYHDAAILADKQAMTWFLRAFGPTSLH